MKDWIKVMMFFWLIGNGLAFIAGVTNQTSRWVYAKDYSSRHKKFAECKLKNFHYIVPANYLGCKSSKDIYDFGETLYEDMK